MSRKYYVLCDSNCKFESMTKEQIITAIEQAVKNGTVGDVDTGFVTTVKTISGTPLKFFVGTQSEYELLPVSQKENLFAIITNDTTKESMFSALEELRIAQESTNAIMREVVLRKTIWEGSEVVSSVPLKLFEDSISLVGREFEIVTNAYGTHHLRIFEASSTHYLSVYTGGMLKMHTDVTGTMFYISYVGEHSSTPKIIKISEIVGGA